MLREGEDSLQRKKKKRDDCTTVSALFREGKNNLFLRIDLSPRERRKLHVNGRAIKR